MLMQKVLVVSANRFYREALLDLFGHDQSLRVLGEIDFSPLLGEQVSRLKPNVVVVSPGQDQCAISATRLIHEAAPEAKLLLVGMRDDEELFLRTVQAGAVGYLLPDASPRRIVATVHRLGRDCVVCPPHLLLALFRAFESGSGLAPSLSAEDWELTPREQQVTALLLDGLENKEIADRLHLSVGTVKTHVHSVLRKTRSKSRAALTHVIEGRQFPACEKVN